LITNDPEAARAFIARHGPSARHCAMCKTIAPWSVDSTIITDRGRRRAISGWCRTGRRSA
jgi:hypothetical protein